MNVDLDFKDDTYPGYIAAVKANPTEAKSREREFNDLRQVFENGKGNPARFLDKLQE